MSKCDVRIELDRPERAYRGGEVVTGRVRVAVNEDVNSNGVVLEHLWRTHGSGNTSSGDKETTHLYAGPLQAGEVLELPFQVIAPHGPPTYHGHHLNIDHYLKARVDVPWAFDPKCEEEYLLVASGKPYEQLPTELSAVSKSGCRQFGVVTGILLLFFGVVFIFPFGLVMIPAGLAVLFFALRTHFAERRLGKVQVDWGPDSITPGGVLPLRVSFTPTKATELNEVRLKLTAREVCVSGSGTNSTTHTHSLHEETVRIAGRQTLVPYQPVELGAEVIIPDLGAYTFHAGDNKLEWLAELKIDLPMWPDWMEKKQLTVRPTPQLVAVDVESAEVPPAERESELIQQVEASAAASEFGGLDTQLEPVANVALSSHPSEAPAPVGVGPLGEVLAAIAAESRYSQERERIVQRHLDESFACPMTIRRTERTYDYDAKEPYRDGRTVHGKLAGTEHDVMVQMKTARNDEVDTFRSGDAFQCQATPVKWNSVYDRLEMREA